MKQLAAGVRMPAKSRRTLWEQINGGALVDETRLIRALLSEVHDLTRLLHAAQAESLSLAHDLEAVRRVMESNRARVRRADSMDANAYTAIMESEVVARIEQERDKLRHRLATMELKLKHHGLSVQNGEEELL